MIDIWIPVPSLGYKYEVTTTGKLRNAETKKVLKKTSSTYYSLTINQKFVFVTIANLLWEAHGILPTKKIKRNVPVTIQKDATFVCFPSIQKAVEYLSKVSFYSEKYIRDFLSKRVTEFSGWKITYPPPEDLSQVESNYMNIIRKKNR